jgi:hypothetical protein
MKTKPIVRTKTTPIRLKEARTLFLELMGGEEAAKKCRRMYVAWHGFRAGLELAQRGRVSANDVAMFRRHVKGGPVLPPAAATSAVEPLLES